MRFRDRIDAARKLAERLREYRDEDVLVLGIPRGGVPLSVAIAAELGADHDVVLAHKIGAPGHEEFAIGAIGEDERVHLDFDLPTAAADRAALESEIASQMDRLRRRREHYRSLRSPRPRKGKTVIIVDDGLATGRTMLAALRSVRADGPKRLIAAAPVASVEAANDVARLADRTVIVEVPVDFTCVGEHYDDFSEVTDTEVDRLLA